MRCAPPSVKLATRGATCVATVRLVAVAGSVAVHMFNGNAMNPIAHPLGGGEGHANGGRQHCSPTGLIDGVKTRKRNNLTDKFIIRRRKKNR